MSGTVEEDSSKRRAAFGALGGSVLLGAVAPSILRKAESSGITFAAWRMLVGAVLCSAAMALRGQFLSARVLRSAAVGGAFFGLSIGLFYASVANTSVTNAMVILSLKPAVVIAAVGPLMSERVRPSTLVWTAVAIAGATFAVVAGSGGGGDASFRGDGIALGGVLAGTGYLVATKRGRLDYDALTFTTAMMYCGAVVLFPLALVTDEGIGPPSSGDWKWVVAMAVLPGFGHVANNYSVAHLPLSIVSNASLLIPGVAAAMAWFLIDETIRTSDVIGMAITIAGLSLVIMSARPSSPIVSDVPQPDLAVPGA